MKKHYPIFTGLMAIAILYGSIGAVRLWQINQGSSAHTINGTITRVTENGITEWGLVADRTSDRLFVASKFLFASLPSEHQVDQKHVRVTYTVQDVIGGTWSVVIAPSAITQPEQ